MARQLIDDWSTQWNHGSAECRVSDFSERNVQRIDPCRQALP